MPKYTKYTSAPVSPPVHNYAFTLNGEKMDTAVTAEQALGLARMSKYHRRDHGAHKDTDIYAVTTFPGLNNIQVLDVCKVVYAFMFALTHSNNDNNLWTKDQILAVVEHEQNHLPARLADYQVAVLTTYANNL